MRLIFILFLLNSVANAATVFDTLYINRGVLTVVDENIELCVFNDSTNFKTENVIIEVSSGDNLQLHIINNDLLDHTFTVDGLIETGNVIPAGGNNDFTLNFPLEGAYRFYSNQPYGRLLGASSIIMYGYDTYPKYYWNMFEQQDTLSEEIALGMETTIPNDYQPDVFTINMLLYPDLTTDTLSYVNQNVGDTIIICVANSGNMEHTLHFHGYHIEIIDASQNSQINGWIKDSFPILIDEVVLIRLVPDQPGTYPVHEHNLINVSTNGAYPGGMLNLLNISP